MEIESGDTLHVMARSKGIEPAQTFLPEDGKEKSKLSEEERQGGNKEEKGKRKGGEAEEAEEAEEEASRRSPTLE